MAKAKTLSDLLPMDPLTLSTIADLARSVGADDTLAAALNSERDKDRDDAAATLRQSTIKGWIREVCPGDYTDAADRTAFEALAKALHAKPAKARSFAPEAPTLPKPTHTPAQRPSGSATAQQVADDADVAVAEAPATGLEQIIAEAAQGTAAVQPTGRSRQTDKTVHQQWANRPADERYTCLDTLYEATRKRALGAREQVVPFNTVHVVPHSQRDNDPGLHVVAGDEVATPTHWSFTQLCQQAGAPVRYLRTLPGHMVAKNLDYGLGQRGLDPERATKLYLGGDPEAPTLLASTSTKYGRVADYQVVDAVRRIAGKGTGDAPWQVPGAIDWSTGVYDTRPQVTPEQTTLYASDRDVFMFLVDHQRPIEVGKLANGDPDVLYRGFYCWNSEVGSTSLGLATFYLRGVCANRIIWGVEGYSQLRIVHGKTAPTRLIDEVQPALDAYAHTREGNLVQQVRKAKALTLAKDDDEAIGRWMSAGFERGQAKAMIETCKLEEGVEPRTLWDMVQGATAWARQYAKQDERVMYERMAGRMLTKALG